MAGLCLRGLDEGSKALVSMFESEGGSREEFSVEDVNGVVITEEIVSS